MRVRQLWQRLPISVKLTAWYGIILSTILFLSGYLTYRLALNQAERYDIQLTKQHAKLVVGLIQKKYHGHEDKGNHSHKQPVLKLNSLFPAGGQSAVTMSLVSQNGSVVAKSPDFPKSISPTYVDQSQAYRVTTSDRHWLVTITPFQLYRYGPRYALWGVLPETALYRSMETVRSISFILDAFFLVIAFVSGYFLARRTLAPVARITHQAASIEADNLTITLDESGPHDELWELTHTFNQMLSRLAKSFEEQQNFLATASHELRTPLTSMLGYAEILADDPGLTERQKRNADAVLRATKRIHRLSEQLLQWSRAEASMIHDDEEVNVSMVVAEVVHEARTRFPHLYAVIPNNVYWQGSSTLLHSSLWILLDNAIKYTPVSKRIFVELQRLPNQLVIHVKDEGVGIEEKALAFIFDRFYRSEEVRAQGIEGFGLGLSILSRYLRLIHGDVQVASRVGVGTTFSLILLTNQ